MVSVHHDSKITLKTAMRRCVKIILTAPVVSKRPGTNGYVQDVGVEKLRAAGRRPTLAAPSLKNERHWMHYSRRHVVSQGEGESA